MKLDVLAVGSHPDDVELACGGTVALLAGTGRRVGILHLTRGELGSRGSQEERHREALAAGRALGVETVDFLDCGDGYLRAGVEEEDGLIERLRLWRPEVIFGPPLVDRHPDHGRAHRLLKAAAFYSGLARRAPDAGKPHRPGVVLDYMQHDSFEPSFVVDVSSTWQQKLAALDAYSSQLYAEQPKDVVEREGPPTKVSSREYRLAVEGRARHFGLLIGAEFGEPFSSRLPLAIADPFVLVPGGIR